MIRVTIARLRWRRSLIKGSAGLAGLLLLSAWAGPSTALPGMAAASGPARPVEPCPVPAAEDEQRVGHARAITECHPIECGYCLTVCVGRCYMCDPQGGCRCL